ncbi:hypothetical protein Tco_0218171 [Tanacetum coccineum]
MTTLAEFMIIAGADNCPPMLEKSFYDSWKSRMELYIENWENRRMILNSFQNGPFVWPTVFEEDGTTRTKRYEELLVAEKLQADCDLKATNIILQGLPPDVYAIVNHHKVSKEIWDRVKLLMQGTKLSLQEKECKLYDEFDKFSYMKGETLKSHLIKDCDYYVNQLNLNTAPVWKNVENIPLFVPRPAYFPAGSRNRPTSVPTSRPFAAGWHIPAARPMTRPKSHYFQQFSGSSSYNQMDMDGGRWGTAVKTSAGCSWQSKRPNVQCGSKNNGGSQSLKFMKVAAFGVHAVNFLMLLQRLSPAIIRFLIQEVWSWFQDVVVQSSRIVTTSRYVVPTGRVKVPAGRYVVPTGKDNVIVSAGRSKVIPAGRTILVLVYKLLYGDYPGLLRSASQSTFARAAVE